ncbi:MAG: polyphenol oxidase family protein [Propioniciclava sp.]
MFGWRGEGAGGVGVAFTALPTDLGDAQDPRARTEQFTAVSTVLGVPIAVTRQVHGASVLAVTAPTAVPALVDHTDVDADVLVTTQPGLGVAVRVADCVPVLMASRDGRAVAAVHAGRAGLLVGAIGAAAEALGERSAAPLVAWVGPHICGACYEVPDSLAESASARLGVPVVRTRWGTNGIDLGAATHRQLAAVGATVVDCSACTLTTATLPSHRRDGGTARAAGIIWRGLA